MKSQQDTDPTSSPSVVKGCVKAVIERTAGEAASTGSSQVSPTMLRPILMYVQGGNTKVSIFWQLEDWLRGHCYCQDIRECYKWMKIDEDEKNL